MANPTAITLAASAARTASGVGSAVDIGALRRVAELVLDVTELSGTDPTLDLVVETSLTQQDWTVATTIARKTAVGAVELLAFGLKRYVRVRWTLGGTTPSFTFELTGVAHVLYCEPRDVTRYAVPESAVEEVLEEEQWRACLVASGEADSYLRGSNILPLVSWGLALRLACSWIAAAIIFAHRGVDKNGPDQTVLDERDNKIKWLEQVAAGKVDADVVDTTPEVFEGGAVVVSQPARGWGR